MSQVRGDDELFALLDAMGGDRHGDNEDAVDNVEERVSDSSKIKRCETMSILIMLDITAWQR